MRMQRFWFKDFLSRNLTVNGQMIKTQMVVGWSACFVFEKMEDYT